MKTLEGFARVGKHQFAIVASRANEFITKRLVEDAVNTLERHGAASPQITVTWVPGSLEIPLTAERLAKSGKYHAVICLGAIIRGDTVHFEHVADEASRGMAAVALATGVPVMHGVIAANSLEQAIQRAGGKGGNRGRDAASAAVAMADLMDQIPASAKSPVAASAQSAPAQPAPAKRRRRRPSGAKRKSRGEGDATTNQGA